MGARWCSVRAPLTGFASVGTWTRDANYKYPGASSRQLDRRLVGACRSVFVARARLRWRACSAACPDNLKYQTATHKAPMVGKNATLQWTAPGDGADGIYTIKSLTLEGPFVGAETTDFGCVLSLCVFLLHVADSTLSVARRARARARARTRTAPAPPKRPSRCLCAAIGRCLSAKPIGWRRRRPPPSAATPAALARRSASQAPSAPSRPAPHCFLSFEE